MRHPAADARDLLRLLQEPLAGAERLLGAAPLLHFGAELLERLAQPLGSFLDAQRQSRGKFLRGELRPSTAPGLASIEPGQCDKGSRNHP